MRLKVRLQVRYKRQVDLVLAALALAVILAGLAGGLVWSPGQAVASPAQAERSKPVQYYLTIDDYPGDQVLAVCALGFHTAALWEILDTSNLRYNTRLGYTRKDSGYGPPATGGWVRTGYLSDTAAQAGSANCQAWTSSSATEYGSFVYLPGDWDAGIEDMMGWAVATAPCSSEIRVWCVGNESVLYLPLLMRNYSG